MARRSAWEGAGTRVWKRWQVRRRRSLGWGGRRSTMSRWSSVGRARRRQMGFWGLVGLGREIPSMPEGVSRIWIWICSVGLAGLGAVMDDKEVESGGVRGLCWAVERLE
jgi:hypothetical protein